MIKCLEFDSLEEFNEVDLRLTTELNSNGIICERYALPIERGGKFLMIIDERYSSYFTEEELNNAVEYLPLHEN